MRVIVFGVGAVGGTIAAQLHLSGAQVAGIARGRHLEAMQARGLAFFTPEGSHTAAFPVFANPGEAGITAEDAILLTMKTQDTAGALSQLAAAGVRNQPVFCFQNGVENERLAQRSFPNVYSATVILPADFQTPGEVVAHGIPRAVFVLGRYPTGQDETAEALGQVLARAGFRIFARPDAMGAKYAKLLVNLRNIIEVLFADRAVQDSWYQAARKEGEAALTAAGIAWDVSDATTREGFRTAEVPGKTRLGSSTMQSVLRGTGSVETDYLNGEIALLGRLHGVATPVNARLCDLGALIARGALQPGTADTRLPA